MSELLRLRCVIAKALPPKKRVDEIRHAYTAIHALATLLTPGVDTAPRATEVAAAVACWTAQLDAALGATPRERTWRAHFRKIVGAFGERIFRCYDHPWIPRTNNDMEQALRALSARERRITGRKHVGAKLVRIGGLVGAAEILVNEPDARERIAILPDAERRGFQPRRQRVAKPRGQALAFRRNPAAFLATVENL